MKIFADVIKVSNQMTLRKRDFLGGTDPIAPTFESREFFPAS